MVDAFFAGLDGLSKKTKLNHHAGLSTLWTWTWALKLWVVEEDVIKQYERPKPAEMVIEICMEEELQKLFGCWRPDVSDEGTFESAATLALRPDSVAAAHAIMRRCRGASSAALWMLR